MVLNLQIREIPMVKKRYELPEFLAGGEPCYIEFEARAAGVVNDEYMSALDRVQQLLRIRALEAKEAQGARARVEHDEKSAIEVVAARLAALYDACMISWSTNIWNDGKPMQSPGRAEFLALCEARVPELGKAILDFEKRCQKAGEIILKDDEDTAKN